MKYLIITVFSIYSLHGMKPPAATPPLNPEEQILQLQEQIKAIKEKQITHIGNISAALNQDICPGIPNQSILIPAEQLKQMTAETFAKSVNLQLQEQLEKNIRESGEAIRRLSECHSRLMDFKKRKEKGKKLTDLDQMNELSSYHQTKHAIEEAFKKITESEYYLDIYYAKEENKPTKPVIAQED